MGGVDMPCVRDDDDAATPPRRRCDAAATPPRRRRCRRRDEDATTPSRRVAVATSTRPRRLPRAAPRRRRGLLDGPPEPVAVERDRELPPPREEEPFDVLGRGQALPRRPRVPRGRPRLAAHPDARLRQPA